MIEDSGRSPCLTEYVSFKMGLKVSSAGKRMCVFECRTFPVDTVELVRLCYIVKRFHWAAANSRFLSFDSSYTICFIIVTTTRLLLYSRFLTSFLYVSITLCSQLPVWLQQSHNHLPNHVAFEFFSSLLLVYLSFCLQLFAYGVSVHTSWTLRHINAVYVYRVRNAERIFWRRVEG